MLNIKLCFRYCLLQRQHFVDTNTRDHNFFSKIKTLNIVFRPTCLYRHDPAQPCLAGHPDGRPCGPASPCRPYPPTACSRPGLHRCCNRQGETCSKLITVICTETQLLKLTKVSDYYYCRTWSTVLKNQFFFQTMKFTFMNENLSMEMQKKHTID